MQYSQNITKYEELILKWNKSHNLISRNDIQNLKERHIKDCEQLYQYIPKSSENIVDLGSGGGLPAVIIALKDKQESIDRKVFAIESNVKKITFLKKVKRELELENFFPIEQRIEKLKPDLDILPIITARAFASLEDIFDISEKLYNKETNFILLKGNRLDEEIEIARKSFSFNYKIHPSTIGNGNIMIADQVSKI
jgi:16S rRNA (guanine527-N7)-methyltransferase